jgi:hypothetical protein
MVNPRSAREGDIYEPVGSATDLTLTNLIYAVLL